MSWQCCVQAELVDMACSTASILPTLQMVLLLRYTAAKQSSDAFFSLFHLAGTLPTKSRVALSASLADAVA